MLDTPGLRVSIAGGMMVVLGAAALLFMADTIPAIVMMVGGVAVIGGFVNTLAQYYLPHEPPDEPRQPRDDE